MTNQPLPDGFGVRLGHDVRVRDGRRTLMGGSPTRVLYLTPAASALLAQGTLRVTDSATAKLADHLLEVGLANPDLDTLRPQSTADVTYVIPVWNRAAEAARLLGSIGSGARVIVVDDCSDDPHAIAQVAHSFGAELIRLPQNVGVAGARNAGLKLVKTPFVAFVDSDVVLLPDSIPTMLKHFADPRVAVVAPRVVGLTGSRASWINRYEDGLSSLDLGRHPAMVRPRTPVAWVSGTTLVARVDLVGEGFNAAMRSGEDVDFVWRLFEEGLRVRYEPAAMVLHEHRTTVVAWMKRKAFYGTGAFALAERHPDSIAPAILAPWAAGLVLALAAQRRLSLPVAIGIGAATALKIASRLTRSTHPLTTAAGLTANGAVAAVTQSMALLLRHWWPAVAVAMPFSRRLRRAVLFAHVADVALQHARTRTRLDPLRFGLARRLDDLSYGAGVWYSVLRGGSLKALKPDLRKHHSETR